MRPGGGGPGGAVRAPLLSLSLAATRVALATARLQSAPHKGGVESPALGKCGVRGGRNAASRAARGARPALAAASGLAWAAGGGRAARRARGEGAEPARPTRLCLLCSPRWQRRGGRGGQRAQFSAPRSPGNSCGSARPTSGGAGGGGREVAARRSRARSGRRPPRRAHPAGPGPVVSAGPGAGAVGTRRCGAPWGEGPEASTPRGRGSPGEWWAASVLRVGTTLLRAKEKSGGSACNAIGRRRRWSRSSAPPPRRRSLRRSRPAPSPPSQDPRRGPFPASPERREVARGRADWEVEASSRAVTTALTDCAGGGLSLLPRSPRGRLPSPCSDCPWVLAGAG